MIPASITPLVTIDNAPTWQDFPGFYDNPAIERIADESRWTISNANKAPMDLQHWWAHERGEMCEVERCSVVNYADHTDERSLVTLPELVALVPNAANHTFYLQADVDELLILDIEPSCPPDLRTQLLALPHLYAETSMSGQGLHLIMAPPANEHEFPAALTKVTLQHPDKWFEILRTHYVTFTRNLVDPVHVEQCRQAHPNASWEQVYADLAAKAVVVEKMEFDLAASKPDIDGIDDLVSTLVDVKYHRTPEDFGHGFGTNKMSEWEFGYIGFMYHALQRVVHEREGTDRALDLDDSDRTWIIYDVIEKVLPHRSRHDELRNGQPYLLWRVETLVAMEAAKRARRESEQAQHPSPGRVRTRTRRIDDPDRPPEGYGWS